MSCRFGQWLSQALGGLNHQVVKSNWNRHMKTYSYRVRSVSALIVAWLFIACAVDLAKGYESSRAAVAETGFAKTTNGAARVIICRIANLGYNVIVNLRIDGVVASPLMYGRSSEILLPPGRHVVALLPTPHPKWPVPSYTIINVRRNRTYDYMVMSDHSGHLILREGPCY